MQRIFTSTREHIVQRILLSLSLYYPNIIMELMLRNVRPSDISLCLQILLWNMSNVNKGFFSNLFFHFHSLSNFASQKWRALTTTSNTNPNCTSNLSFDCINDVNLTREEVILVMENLGIRVESDGEGIMEMLHDNSLLFEKDPSMEEVEEAFKVFDENNDGFIDARELKRVLCCLGVETNMEECQKMIRNVDQNGDDLVDFNEFEKLMEQGLSTDIKNIT